MASPARSPQRVTCNSILFVDDDAALRCITPMLLTAKGYEVRTAQDGLEALQVIKQSLPELIISDLRMPRMSGFEFLSIVRRKYPAIPTIAISGEFVSGTEMMGIADAFFCKGSYSPDQLCSRIEDLLLHPPERRDLETPPIWVPVGPSGEVILTCTDCLRSFPVRICPPQAGNAEHETECIVCGTVLRYRVDHTALNLGPKNWGSCGMLVNLAIKSKRDDD